MNQGRLGSQAVRSGGAVGGLIPAPVWVHEGLLPPQLPMIVPDEVADLTYRYGVPERRIYSVQADNYIYRYRFGKVTDRRAEVVFAVEDDAGRIWVHAKPHYPSHIFRLPSGGIHWDELVTDALVREIKEEMGLAVEVHRFLGIIEYHFWHGDVMAPFVSYVFHLRAEGGQPQAQQGEEICGFRAVLPNQVGQIALELRNLMGDRRGWGQWRALAHDLVYDTLH